MGKTYAEQLKDPRWQKKRLEILDRDGFACVFCGSGLNNGTTLHVDHKRYGRTPWEVDNDALQTLCEDCHERVTKIRRVIKAIVEDFDIVELLEAQGLLLSIRPWDLPAADAHDVVLESFARGHSIPISGREELSSIVRTGGDFRAVVDLVLRHCDARVSARHALEDGLVGAEEEVLA